MGETGIPQLLAGAAEGPETGYGAILDPLEIFGGGWGAARIGVVCFVFPSMMSFILSSLTLRKW